MHFEYSTKAEECVDELIPWTEKQKAIFDRFCKEYRIQRTVSKNTDYWYGANDFFMANKVFDHVNAWFDADHRIVLSACPYNHIKKYDAMAYADDVEKNLWYWYGVMSTKPYLKKWDKLRSTAHTSMRDHVHYYPEGYHHDKTALVVVDADGVGILKILRKMQ